MAKWRGAQGGRNIALSTIYRLLLAPRQSGPGLRDATGLIGISESKTLIRKFFTAKPVRETEMYDISSCKRITF